MFAFVVIAGFISGQKADQIVKTQPRFKKPRRLKKQTFHGIIIRQQENES